MPEANDNKAHKWATKIREMGYAVIVWSPEELKNVDPKNMEELSVQYGHEVLADLCCGFDAEEEEE